MKTPTGLFAVAYHVTKASGVYRVLWGLIFLMVLSATMAYYEASNFTSMVTSSDPLKFVQAILTFQLLSLGVSFTETCLMKKYFIPDLHKAILHYMWTLIAHADPLWACKHGTFYLQIEDAVLAVKGIIINSRELLRPLFMMIAQIF